MMGVVSILTETLYFCAFLVFPKKIVLTWIWKYDEKMVTIAHTWYYNKKKKFMLLFYLSVVIQKKTVLKKSDTVLTLKIFHYIDFFLLKEY